ncbi:MAG: hypothetical protein LBL66_04300 [Clostridiales bacterium]|nr:hypothetical protein [Clostridiales bacterium]
MRGARSATRQSLQSTVHSPQSTVNGLKYFAQLLRSLRGARNARRGNLYSPQCTVHSPQLMD